MILISTLKLNKQYWMLCFLSTFDNFSAEYAVCLHFCCLFCGLWSKWETTRKTKCKYIMILNYKWWLTSVFKNIVYITYWTTSFWYVRKLFFENGSSAECECHRSTFGSLTPILWSVVKSFKGVKSTLYLNEAEKWWTVICTYRDNIKNSLTVDLNLKGCKF